MDDDEDYLLHPEWANMREKVAIAESKAESLQLRNNQLEAEVYGLKVKLSSKSGEPLEQP